MTFPQYPNYPQGQQVPPQYPPQQFQPYPAPQYPPQQVPPQQPSQPLPKGSLDEFFDQPSAAEGPALKFKDKPEGTSYAGIVARPITDGDIRPQTNPQNGQPVTYRDGRPKFVMVIPLKVQPSQEFPEGKATWWVRGQARDELVRAMSEAGAPGGAPEAGAGVSVTLTGRRSVPGMNPQHVYAVRYQRPQNAQQAEQAPPEPAPEPVQQVPQPAQAPVQQQPQQVAPQPVQQPVQTAPQPPSDLSPEQQQLLANLTQQQG